MFQTFTSVDYGMFDTSYFLIHNGSIWFLQDNHVANDVNSNCVLF